MESRRIIKASAEQFFTAKRAQSFVADVKSEIHKITWTSPGELAVYTKIVVIATFALGMAIYGLDVTIQIMLSGLNLLAGVISN